MTPPKGAHCCLAWAKTGKIHNRGCPNRAETARPDWFHFALILAGSLGWGLWGFCHAIR